MNDWLNKTLESIKSIWTKWTTVQKVIFLGIVVFVFVGLALVIGVSSSTDTVYLIKSPISSDEDLDRIVMRLQQENNLDFQVTEDNRIIVDSEQTSRRLKAILVREDLLPNDVRTWDFLNVSKFTMSEWDKEEKKRVAVEKDLELLIEALNDIDNANIIISLPDESLFKDEQRPTTVSCALSPTPGSDFVNNRSKVEGVQKLIEKALSGLKVEDIIITDLSGVQINDFENMGDFDRLKISERQLKIKEKYEELLKEKIELVLLDNGNGPLTDKRVSISKVEVDMKFNEESYIYNEIVPIVLQEDNTDTPYYDGEIIDKILLETVINKENYKGTGFNPEGPAGVEGQVPPAYKDLEGLVGQYSKDQNETRYDVSRKTTDGKLTPWQINGVSVSVAVDGIWVKDRTPNGSLVTDNRGGISRTFTQVSDEYVMSIKKLVEGSIKANKDRGDTVNVTGLQFDRTREHEIEDAAFRRAKKTRTAMLYSLLGVVVIIFLVFFIRAIVRYRERMQRLREEELLKRQAALRQAAIESAQDDVLDIPMSGEDSAVQKSIQEALAIARENPEDVAHLVRTWLVEE